MHERITPELASAMDQVQADEALSVGLVNQVVPPEELNDAVTQMANTLANAAPIAI